jgi:hypothetical protein
METIINMFASFVGFCGGVILITETVNKVFKVEGTTAKFIVSWVVAIGMACLGFGLQLGIFDAFGEVGQWQGWVKTVLVGVFCAVCSNRTYDMNEIWRALQIIFSFFDRDGKAIREAIREEIRKEKEAKRAALKRK